MGVANEAEEAQKNGTFNKGGDKDLSKGPIKDRGCTDIVCVIVLLAWWALFIFVTMLAFKDGHPEKLRAPRDFRGDFCGMKEQWNSDLDLDAMKKQTFVMNVSESAHFAAQQLVCSSLAEAELEKVLNATELEKYRCDCCRSPCDSCWGSFVYPDITSLDQVATSNSIQMMGDLTSPSKVAELFSPTGVVQSSSVFDHTDRYFIEVCAKGCNHGATDPNRTYTYSPAPDVKWAWAWDKLRRDGPSQMRDTIANSFDFQALPLSECPYAARYCVPYPGVTFNESDVGSCSFKVAGAALDAVGEAAANAFEELADNKIAEAVEENIGSAFGDLIESLDALVLVCVCAFVIGLVYLVLLRFVVGCVVWSSLFVVFLLFVACGFLLIMRSSQCSGAGLFESGENSVHTVLFLGAAAVQTVVAGQDLGDESLSGVNGAGYRGRQTRTQSGHHCQDWNAQSPHTHSILPAAFPNASLVENYCRNPTGAPTIWCFTQDPEQRWDTCQPLGVLLPECPHGHEVKDEKVRKILEIAAYVFWALSVFWIIFVSCMCGRIRLAIGVNKVAAQFIYSTPQILFLPIVQILVAVAWIVVWVVLVSFVLSMVPDGFTDTKSFATYAEAVEECESGWPSQGWAWRDEEGCSSTSSDPMCFKCAPPRFTLNHWFAVYFFTLLWNNAILIALGQIIVAGAVGAWFFAPHEEKKKTWCVRTSVKNAFRYHFGTVALGAFLIAKVQFLRYFLKFLEKQGKGQPNRVVVYILKALQYLLWCFEKCLKFLNKNAYIQTALLGTSFCTSAKNAFFLIVRNAARFACVATLGSVIYFLGSIFIMAATLVSGYFILAGLHTEISPVVPMVVYGVLGYVVAKLYMNVFGLAVDSVLQCFIAAEEMGDAEGYAPSGLASLLSGPKS